MSKLVRTAEQQIKKAIETALEKAMESGALPQAELPEINVEVPADRANGDYSSNAALASARIFRTSPRAIADAVKNNISLDGTYFERCEVAGAGFINFFFKQDFYSDIVLDILQSGESYGSSDMGAGKRINVEFVSANPTGPMHMGNARGGALGDCLAAVLEKAGYEVEREFYVNDAGNQIDKFALSLDIRYKQLFLGEDAVELPEDSYHGNDITERAKQFAEIYGDEYMNKSEEERRKALVDFALPKNIALMKENMSKYRIVYDTWFMESTLHNGEIEDCINILKKNGCTYEKDGALWYKNAELMTKMLLSQGKTPEEIEKLELKDDVLIRQNGNPTYFAADIAYHRNKLEKRNFDTAIDIWGADHHGHVARMKCALEAIGIDSSRLEIVLMQLVNLVKDGKPVKMSKRTGDAITLSDLLDEIPVDAARFFFNMREAGSTIDFDLGLAAEQTSQNPVYYCQYAHARICSIIKKAAAEGVEIKKVTGDELALLTSPEETEIIRFLSTLTAVIEGAAKFRDVARITHYVYDLATLFHKFYNAHKVMVDDERQMQARLSLCICVRDTLRNLLSLLKITAPESM
ncbi:MAG: arginine--tRNA ligase [Clostridiales bacterium]|nr:arginine--tRNA ligase [Clostridiales bacterium]